MRILFCSDPLDKRQADSAYAAEASAAKEAGFDIGLVNFEALVYENDARQAVRAITAAPTPEQALYRGWMLTGDQYGSLYEALLARNVVLINDPAQYLFAHSLPENYAVIAPLTPQTVWLAWDGDAFSKLPTLLRPFGSGPLILKDYVKSRKHEWHEACFIPSASDMEAVNRVVTTFVRRQGDDLNGGLVFREFVPYQPLAEHPQSGMPLTKEFRVFFLDAAPVFVTPYWDEGDYAAETPPLESFLEIARQVQSRFFTMDVAQRIDGEWMIVELGDGQVAGLPERADLGEFYAALSTRIS